jgi:3-oxoacyl-[acyl-carrier protein] reductase
MKSTVAIVTGASQGIGRATALRLAQDFSSTNRRKTYMEKYAPAHDMTLDEAMLKFPAQAGISRYGQPEEIADLVAFLLSPQAKWMTGSAVRMDGGEIKGI